MPSGQSWVSRALVHILAVLPSPSKPSLQAHSYALRCSGTSVFIVCGRAISTLIHILVVLSRFKPRYRRIHIPRCSARGVFIMRPCHQHTVHVFAGLAIAHLFHDRHIHRPFVFSQSVCSVACGVSALIHISASLTIAHLPSRQAQEMSQTLVQSPPRRTVRPCCAFIDVDQLSSSTRFSHSPFSYCGVFSPLQPANTITAPASLVHKAQ